VACEHDGYREIVTQYNRVVGLLTYFWRCETCGLVLHEASQLRYRPRFAPLPQMRHLERRQGMTPRRVRADQGPEWREPGRLV